MSELAIRPDDERTVTVEFDESLYPRDAIYGAAYIFLDRCYVRLDRPAAGRVSVRLERKAAVAAALDDLVGEFQNELLGQAWRRQILEENRAILERVSARAAAGSAGPPGLDDLLQVDPSSEAFDDPLGIAMSWEDRYKKKPDAGSSVPAEASSSGPSGAGSSGPSDAGSSGPSDAGSSGPSDAGSGAGS